MYQRPLQRFNSMPVHQNFHRQPNGNQGQNQGDFFRANSTLNIQQQPHLIQNMSSSFYPSRPPRSIHLQRRNQVVFGPHGPRPWARVSAPFHNHKTVFVSRGKPVTQRYSHSKLAQQAIVSSKTLPSFDRPKSFENKPQKVADQTMSETKLKVDEIQQTNPKQMQVDEKDECSERFEVERKDIMANNPPYNSPCIVNKDENEISYRSAWEEHERYFSVLRRTKSAQDLHPNPRCEEEDDVDTAAFYSWKNKASQKSTKAIHKKAKWEHYCAWDNRIHSVPVDMAPQLDGIYGRRLAWLDTVIKPDYKPKDHLPSNWMEQRAGVNWDEVERRRKSASLYRL